MASSPWDAEHDIAFDLVSDMNREAIRAYDLEIDIPELGLYDIATRAAFVRDDDVILTYRWEADDPTNESDYDELIAAA